MITEPTNGESQRKTPLRMAWGRAKEFLRMASGFARELFDLLRR